MGKQRSFHGWVVRIWLVFILLTAVFLRLHLLPTVPPGLTHDEADHGISAWGVVNGERPIYFTIGYGREPLYDYGTAVLMTVLGPTYLAGRLTAVFFSLILLAGTYAWVRRAFDAQTALYTIAGLAVGFWPLMTARHMLRSVTLPALFVLAVTLFWRGFPSRSSLLAPRSSLLPPALLLGLTFYTYIPSRVLWLLFPLVVGYAMWIKRPFPNLWRKTAVLLLGAGLVGLPLFYYLYTHPGAEVRIGQLSEPLKAAWHGQWQPLGQNVLAGAKILTIAGDPFERYNVPGQPLLPWWLGIFFYVGVGVAGWRVLRPQNNPSLAIACFFALTWLLAGLAPALITGPRLSTTQTIGMQPALYLLVAVGMGEVFRFLSEQAFKWRGARGEGRSSQFTIHNSQFIIFPLFLLTAVFTYHRYFTVWANLPAVRVQYETTMIEAMRYLNETGEGVVGVSTITPAAVHSPAVAQMVLYNEAVSLRWFDGNHALVIPQNGRSTLIFPGFASPPPILSRYLDSAVLQQTLPLRPTDLDRPLTIYQIDGEAWLEEWMPVFKKYSVISTQYSVGEGAVEFVGYDLPALAAQPGEMVQMVTVWRVIRPFPEAKLFVQLLQPESGPIAQDDRLDAPGYNWQPGDIFVQLHQFTIPPETAVGSYPLIIGLYNNLTGERLPILMDGVAIPDHLNLQPITIKP